MKQKSNGKVFYLDDENDLLEFVRFVLEKYNYEVITGLRWDEKYLDELDDVDMIILDIMFPEEEFDGYQICEKLKEDYRTRDIPIYMFSAKAFIEDKQKAEKVGAQGFIEKPVSVEELVKLVNSVVKGEK